MYSLSVVMVITGVESVKTAPHVQAAKTILHAQVYCVQRTAFPSRSPHTIACALQYIYVVPVVGLRVKF